MKMYESKPYTNQKKTFHDQVFLIEKFHFISGKLYLCFFYMIVKLLRLNEATSFENVLFFSRKFLIFSFFSFFFFFNFVNWKQHYWRNSGIKVVTVAESWQLSSIVNWKVFYSLENARSITKPVTMQRYPWWLNRKSDQVTFKVFKLSQTLNDLRSKVTTWARWIKSTNWFTSMASALS